MIAVRDVADAVVTDRRRSEGVATIAMDLRANSTAKREGGKSVIVREQNHSVDQLREGPAVRLSFQEALAGEWISNLRCARKHGSPRQFKGD